MHITKRNKRNTQLLFTTAVAALVWGNTGNVRRWLGNKWLYAPSWNHFGWKRPLRSSSATGNPSQPPLTHVTLIWIVGIKPNSHLPSSAKQKRCQWLGDWIRKPLKVPSNPNYSMSLLHLSPGCSEWGQGKAPWILSISSSEILTLRENGLKTTIVCGF